MKFEDPEREPLTKGCEASGSPDTVIDAATRVIAAFGIEGATIDRIGAESGLSRATLYRRSGGRDEIIRAVLRREAAPIAKEARRALAGQGDISGSVVSGFVAAIEGLGAESPAIPSSMVQPCARAKLSIAASLPQATTTGFIPMPTELI